MSAHGPHCHTCTCGCTCGYGGQHEPGKATCELNATPDPVEDRMAAILRDLVSSGGVMALEWWRRTEVMSLLAEYEASA